MTYESRSWRAGVAAESTPAAPQRWPGRTAVSAAVVRRAPAPYAPAAAAPSGETSTSGGLAADSVPDPFDFSPAALQRPPTPAARAPEAVRKQVARGEPAEPGARAPRAPAQAQGAQAQGAQAQGAQAQGAQAQGAQAQGAPGAAPAPVTTAASGALLARTRAAIASAALPAIRAALSESNAVAPPTAESREAAKLGREWLMEQVAAARGRHGPLIAATTNHDQREQAESRLDAECTPYLELLREGPADRRYQHSDPRISAEVAAALRLHTLRRAASFESRDAAAHDEAVRVGGVTRSENWCGAFAHSQAVQAGGFDPNWSGVMASVPRIVRALQYDGHTAGLWIWDGAWIRLRDYHHRRGSMRAHQLVGTSAPSGGILPGDLVFIDNTGRSNPDHVAIALTFDGRYLTTVGGNQGASPSVDSEASVSRSQRPFDLQRNPPADAVDRAYERAQEAEQGSPAARTNHLRVHSIGRWSVVDYERHIYSDRARPTAPPSADELASVGR